MPQISPSRQIEWGDSRNNIYRYYCYRENKQSKLAYWQAALNKIYRL